jgi:GTP:adenosylcobinamide-phosphate guanylyltransferase
MRAPVTVVISCAGEGRRLELGKTKALVHVLDRPIIAWHLSMLRHVENVRVVVGYQAEDIIEVVSKIRRDVVFVFNRDYKTTGTASSLTRAAAGVAGDLISLDGDLLVHPHDFNTLLDRAGPCLGVLPAVSDDPVLVTLQEGPSGPLANGFVRGPREGLEWSGLVRLPIAVIERAKALNLADGHVYQMIEPSLPMPIMQVRAREIDTPADYDRAMAWMKPIAHYWFDS